MQNFCIRCEECNNRYILGEDAAIATLLGVFAHLGHGRGGVVGDGAQSTDGTQSNPDLVDTSSLSPAEYAQKFGAEVERIKSSLSSGMKRWWKCNNCKAVQTYSPITISVKEFTGTNEEEAEATARSAIPADRIINVSLQAPNKGILGIGKKPAIARVRYEVEGTDEWTTNHATDLAASREEGTVEVVEKPFDADALALDVTDLNEIFNRALDDALKRQSEMDIDDN